MLKKIIILFIILLFSFNALASTSEQLCGVDQNGVIAFDTTICKEDLSFKVFNYLFPTEIKQMLNIFNFEEVETENKDPFIKTQLTLNNSSSMLSVIMRYIQYLAIAIFAAGAIHELITGLVKSKETGEFFGGKSRFKIFLSSAALSTLLMTKIGNTILVSILVFMLAVFGVSIANFGYSTYLSRFAETTFTSPIYKDSIDPVSGNKIISTSFFYAKDYVDNMTKIELCRNTTARFQLETIPFRSKSEFNEQLVCALPTTKHVKTNYDRDDISFFNHNLLEISDKYSKVYKIDFGLRGNNQCDQDIMDFNCGSIDLPTTDSHSTQLLTVVEDEYVNVVKEVVSKLSDNDQSNYEIINEGWSQFYAKIPTILKAKRKSLQGSLLPADFLKVQNIDKVLQGRGGEEIKELAYSYHQDILNSTLFGTSFYLNNSNNKPIKLSNDSILYTKYIVAIEKISAKTNEFKCLNESNLLKSKNFLNSLNSGFALGNIKCIDLEKLKVMGLNGDDLYQKEELNEQRNKLKKNLNEDYYKLINDVYSLRVTLSTSLKNSYDNVANDSFVNEARSKGWLNTASIMFDINSEVDRAEQFKNIFTNSIRFNKSNHNMRMISEDVYDSDLATDIGYSWYLNSNDIWRESDKDQKIPVGVDFGLKVADSLSGNIKDMHSSEFSFTQFLRFLGDPLMPFKDGLGISFESDLNSKCSIDHTYCHIEGNPLVKIVKVGKYFVNTSVSYFSNIIIMKTSLNNFKAYNYRKNKSKLDQNSFVSDHKKNKAGQKARNTRNHTLNVTAISLDFINGLLYVINGFAILMLLIGLIMAYIIPIIPFLYFFMGGVSWFLMVLSLMLVSPIWAGYLVRYNQSRDIIFGFCWNYGLQVLLKPLLMVLSIILILEVYSIVFFVLNISISGVISSVIAEEQGYIMAFVSALIIAAIIALIYYKITKYCFSLIDYVNETVFSVLSVQVRSDDVGSSDNMVQKVIALIAFNKAMGVKKNVSAYDYNKLTQSEYDKAIKDIKQNRKELKERIWSENPDVESDKFHEIYKEEVSKDPSLYGYRKEGGKFISMTKRLNKFKSNKSMPLKK